MQKKENRMTYNEKEKFLKFMICGTLVRMLIDEWDLATYEKSMSKGMNMYFQNQFRGMRKTMLNYFAEKDVGMFVDRYNVEITDDLEAQADVFRNRIKTKIATAQLVEYTFINTLTHATLCYIYLNSLIGLLNGAGFRDLSKKSLMLKTALDDYIFEQGHMINQTATINVNDELVFIENNITKKVIGAMKRMNDDTI